MNRLRHTLVSDGPTDANLLPIIDWCLQQTGRVQLTEGYHAEFWRLPESESPRNLADRMIGAVKLFPCDVLFVHRDAERGSSDDRVDEIRQAYAKVSMDVPAVAVVPVRMLEAWLLFDEAAIRNAAGNPNGTSELDLPPLRKVESRPDPKDDLMRALQKASGLTGRRLKKFDTHEAFWRIVDHIRDYSPLRELSAFQTFEMAIRRLSEKGWSAGFYG